MRAFPKLLELLITFYGILSVYLVSIDIFLQNLERLPGFDVICFEVDSVDVFINFSLTLVILFLCWCCYAYL